MSSNGRTILVTGATGQQGGATSRQLLARGWPVCALTRNPDGTAAQALAQAVAEVVQGDLDDRASLDAVLSGVYGVFSFPNMAMGIDGEVRQGKIVADAAKEARVQHFVQGSVGAADRNSGVPHFESKWQVEEYVRSLGLPATFLRPAYFMENLNWKREQILNGTLESMGLETGTAVQMVAVEDIGAFVTLAFENPNEYIGLALELAGDEITEAQMADVLTRVTGRTVNLTQPEGPPLYEDMVTMVNWFNAEGYAADIPALRNRYSELMDFETWLQKSGWGA